MSDESTNRRGFIRSTGVGLATAGALGAFGIPSGHCQESGTPEEKPTTDRPPHPEAKQVSRQGRLEKAQHLMKRYHNCCTSVLAAYAPELGMEEELAVRATLGMPGIGLSGSVCGTVSGAALVIGLKTTSEGNIGDAEVREKALEVTREFVARFQDRHASICCRDLLGRDISTKEKLEAAIKDEAFANCRNFVESAVSILEELFDDENSG